MNATTVWHLIQAKQASSPNRLWKDIGWILAILIAILVLGNLAEPMGSHQGYAAFVIAMFVVAIIELGGRTFSEYKSPKQAMTWLTLPASTSEKWVSQFLVSFLAVPIIMLAALTVASLVAGGIITLFHLGEPLVLFNPFTYEGWASLRFYWCLHPLLFFGTLYFKKRPMLKTFGFLSLFILAMVFYTIFVADWLLHDSFAYLDNLDIDVEAEEFNEEEMFGMLGEQIHVVTQGFEITFIKTLKVIAQTLAVLYFPFFWGLSYLRLKELEL